MFDGWQVLTFSRSRTGISQVVFNRAIEYFLIGNIYLAFWSNDSYLPER
jgi:hypothetical protein